MMKGSKYILTRQAQNLIEAIGFARRIGLPLNEFITIQWSRADPGADPVARLKTMLDRAREWFRRRDLELTYIYVHEHGDLGLLHSHIMIHLPGEHWPAFDSMVCQWMDSECHEHLIETKPVHDELGLIRYLLKGVEPSGWSRSWGIQTQDQGVIQGKRCGTSENIGAAARTRYGLGQRRNETEHASIEQVRARIGEMVEAEKMAGMDPNLETKA
jgi:hypothetical protein